MLKPFEPTTNSPDPRKVRPDEAHAASQAGALLIDVRDARLYDNARLDPSVSVPLAEITASGGRLPSRLTVPDDALLILYCA